MQHSNSQRQRQLPATDQAQRQQLRQQLKQRRAALSPQQRQQAAQRLVEQVLPLLASSPAKLTVALYHSFADELNTEPLLQALRQHGQRLLLPVLHPINRGQLLFLHDDGQQALNLNRFGIAEPQLDCRKVVPLAQIDWLFTPLVGFDQQGQRLGMGGGFYDRTFGRYPQLQVAGLAYDCQQVERLPSAAWDVPLPLIVTPTRYYRFDSGSPSDNA
ncbi:5-formyltetrahydrofolate cyclo-ligase [Idiomarina xiamenensis]|uniref:5-formyltetrahydrofolate cyclo-ligase n=1 Tax=Idiomarina xiamenensis 10-D-4 TaxID=740709 RepID=K2KM67_9GAMM|nr:5-formyltetrahydrofolate cyclo-ligase [Idiomarina xiamenensis]EKE87632.1 protein YgfA [Idiomarina xiamenensis 10-D-4]